MSVRQVKVDDLDGETEAAETIRFGIDDQAFEIDLNQEHADVLRETLEQYALVARRSEFGQQVKRHRAQATKVRRRPRQSTYTPAEVNETKEPEVPVERPDIRSWARANGYRVGDRGRVSGLIREAYSRAMREDSAA